jgi:predicted Zn-dependent protease
MRRTFIAATLLTLGAVPVIAQTTRSISASEKAQGAQANPQLLAEYGGPYAGPQSAYVVRVGKRVAVQSGLSNAEGDFTVTLLNSPVENAFAIPGGYVYVTRQLLALMNSEAELASVLGHEVGHVAARHSRSRQRASTIGSLLAAGAGALTGSNIASQVVGQATQLGVLKYGRDQEYQADGLGVRYIAAAGYDPYAAADMLAALGQSSALSARLSGRGGNALPSWVSSHPNSADRVKRARQLAAATGRAEPPETQDVAFLRMLDGLAYDDDAAQGIVEGQQFRHPALRVRFTAPSGYTIASGSDAVTIAGTGGQAQFKTAAATGDLSGFVTQQLRTLGATSSSPPQSGQTNGLRYAAATTRATASGRAVDVTVVAYAFPGATHWFTLVTAAGSGVGAFAPLIASVAALTPAEAGQIRGKRIRIHTVRTGDTVATLARQMAYPTAQLERFTTLNGIDSGATLRPGMLVKLVVSG